MAGLVAAKEVLPEVAGDGLEVHEVAVAAAAARVLLVLPAGRLAEVGHGGELRDDEAAVVVAALERLEGGGCRGLFAELDVDVPDHVVCEVVAHVEVLDLAVGGELLEDVLVEVLPEEVAMGRGGRGGSVAAEAVPGQYPESRRAPGSIGGVKEAGTGVERDQGGVQVRHLEVLLGLAGVKVLRASVRARGSHEGRVLEHVGQQDRLAHGRLVVHAGAAVAVATCSEMGDRGVSASIRSLVFWNLMI